MKLVPTWSGPLDSSMDLSMADNVLLPGKNDRIGPTTLDEWLAAGTR